MERSMIFGIFGGLGLFLYGMNLAGDGLKRAAATECGTYSKFLHPRQLRELWLEL